MTECYHGNNYLFLCDIDSPVSKCVQDTMNISNYQMSFIYSFILKAVGDTYSKTIFEISFTTISPNSLYHEYLLVSRLMASKPCAYEILTKKFIILIPSKILPLHLVKILKSFPFLDWVFSFDAIYLSFIQWKINKTFLHIISS